MQPSAQQAAGLPSAEEVLPSWQVHINPSHAVIDSTLRVAMAIVFEQEAPLTLERCFISVSAQTQSHDRNNLPSLLGGVETLMLPIKP